MNLIYFVFNPCLLLQPVLLNIFISGFPVHYPKSHFVWDGQLRKFKKQTWVAVRNLVDLYKSIPGEQAASSDVQAEQSGRKLAAIPIGKGEQE